MNNRFARAVVRLALVVAIVLPVALDALATLRSSLPPAYAAAQSNGTLLQTVTLPTQAQCGSGMSLAVLPARRVPGGGDSDDMRLATSCANSASTTIVFTDPGMAAIGGTTAGRFVT